MKRLMSSVAAAVILSATREYATMMAVVTKYGSGYPGGPDPTVQPQDLDPVEEFSGHRHHLVSTVEVANGDSINSKLYFGKVPSNARFCKGSSRLDHDAVTGVNDFDLGFDNDIDNLLDGADITAAGTKDALLAINIDSLHKAAWQHAGYATDPGGELAIVGTLKAAATAAGTVTLTLDFSLAM